MLDTRYGNYGTLHPSSNSPSERTTERSGNILYSFGEHLPSIVVSNNIISKLTREQQNSLKSAAQESPDKRLEALFSALGVTNPSKLLAMLKQMNVSCVQIDAEGKIQYTVMSAGKDVSFPASNLQAFVLSGTLTSETLCNSLLAEIMKMPGEARSMVIQMIVKWAEENREKDKTLQIELNKKLAEKKQALEMFKKSQKNNDINAAIDIALAKANNGNIPTDLELQSLGKPPAELILEIAILQKMLKEKDSDSPSEGFPTLNNPNPIRLATASSFYQWQLTHNA